MPTIKRYGQDMQYSVSRLHIHVERTGLGIIGHCTVWNHDPFGNSSAPTCKDQTGEVLGSDVGNDLGAAAVCR
jgi:hypothetical protein